MVIPGVPFPHPTVKRDRKRGREAGIPTLVGREVYIPLYMPPYLPMYGGVHASLCTSLGALLLTGLKGEGHSAQRGLSSPLRINPAQPGKALKCQRNPLQKGPLHKGVPETYNLSELLPNPPQGHGPPFHTAKGGEATPGPGPCFRTRLIKS